MINRNGQSSTQIVVDFKHPLEGVSFAHCLPNSVPTAMKENMSQNRSQLISSLLSSPSCPFPKRASLHRSKNRTLFYQFLELHEPLKEKNRPNPFLMGKNIKALSKETTPRSHCSRGRTTNQVFYHVFQVIKRSPLLKTLYKPRKRTVREDLGLPIKFW